MPPPDEGDGQRPEYTSPGTKVSPANLDSFAQYLDALADNWSDEGDAGYAKKIQNQLEGDDDWPKFGSFQVAQGVASRYSTARDQMLTSAAQVHAILTDLATATRKIADNYKNAEALNNASVGKVEQLLDKHVDPGPPPGQGNGQGNGQGDGSDPATGPTGDQDGGNGDSR